MKVLNAWNSCYDQFAKFKSKIMYFWLNNFEVSTVNTHAVYNSSIANVKHYTQYICGEIKFKANRAYITKLWK